MKEEFFDYLKKLDEIGDKIISISNQIGNISETFVQTEKELIENQKKTQLAAENYRLVINELMGMKVPQIVIDEHNGILGGVSCFVHGTNLMSDSINITEQTVDNRQLAQGRAIQDIGVGMVNKSSKEISNILSKHL